MTNIQDIIKKFPLLFPKGSCECSSSCGEGWLPLLESLLQELTVLLESKPKKIRDKIYVEQIKEKFGALRVYLPQCATHDMQEVIIKHEIQSMHICETCGERGRLRTGTWWKTRCDVCQKEYEDKKNPPK
jgi:hypothetical protein